MIIDGVSIANELKEDIIKKIADLKTKPGLGIILAGDDMSSKIYVRNKMRFCREVGIVVRLEKMEMRRTENASACRLKIRKSISQFNRSSRINGIIVQLPLPKPLTIYQDEIFKEIDPRKDLDCFNPLTLCQLYSGKQISLPPVVEACLLVLRKYKVAIKGKNILLVGWGRVVGKPLSIVLMKRGATLTIANKYTRDLQYYTKKADIIISAAGKPKIISGKMVKRGVTAIDVGSNMENGKSTGDFDLASLNKKASLLTPVPGGIGPITVAMVAKSLVDRIRK